MIGDGRGQSIVYKGFQGSKYRKFIPILRNSSENNLTQAEEHLLNPDAF